MKTKHLLIIGGVLVAAGAIYWYVTKKSAAPTMATKPNLANAGNVKIPDTSNQFQVVQPGSGR